MKGLGLLLLVVSVALAAPQQEGKPATAAPSPAQEEELIPEAEAPAEKAEAETEAPTEKAEAEAPAEKAEAESVTEAASTGGKVKSAIGDQASLDQLAQDFEVLQQEGGIPVGVRKPASSPDDEKFGAKVNIFGVDIPVIVLAKLGLAIVTAAASAIGGGGTAAAAAALGEGVSFPAASDPDAVSRILQDTTDTAAAIFDGDVVGEVYFAQARRSEGPTATTIVTAKFSGVPAGAYRLEVCESGDIKDACSNVGRRYSSEQAHKDAILGNLIADEGGQASAIFSCNTAHLAGARNILDRILILVPEEPDTLPLACAAIVQK